MKKKLLICGLWCKFFCLNVNGCEWYRIALRHKKKVLDYRKFIDPIIPFISYLYCLSSFKINQHRYNKDEGIMMRTVNEMNVEHKEKWSRRDGF